jgi:hypothetical protein
LQRGGQCVVSQAAARQEDASVVDVYELLGKHLRGVYRRREIRRPERRANHGGGGRSNDSKPPGSQLVASHADCIGSIDQHAHCVGAGEREPVVGADAAKRRVRDRPRLRSHNLDGGRYDRLAT